jgi:surface protein
MRSGVTRKKLLTRRKVADLTREIGLGHGGSLNTRIKEFVRPALTDQSIRGAVQDYLAGGARKQGIVHKYGEIRNWDVSNVKNMYGMFGFTRSFNQPLNNWDVSNVTDMQEMFRYAESFNQPLNNWNVSNVEDMEFMFNGARSFNQPLNNWDVSKVTDMRYMFCFKRSLAGSFNQPLNKWNVSNVTNMFNMFLHAHSFNQPLHAPWYQE